MNRHAQTVFSGLALSFLLGCVGGSTNTVRETSAPDAHNILTDGPALLPSMPMQSTGSTRGQKPETPQVAAGTPVTQTSAVAGKESNVAVRIRAPHVNGHPIMESEVREALVMRMNELAQVPESARAKAIQEVTVREIDRLVERELVLQDAITKISEIKKPQLLEDLKREAGKEADKRIKDFRAATKSKSDEEFAVFMQRAGLSIEGLRRQTERTFMMNEYIRSLIFPSIQRINVHQIREYYEEHQAEFLLPDRVKWMDIFVDASRFPDVATARAHAESLIVRARQGEDFAALVKGFDHGDSSLRNGIGLGEKRGEIQPAIAENVVFSLKAGEVGQLIDMGFGFHVVKVIERDHAGAEPFDEKCQAKIKKMLGNQIAEREYKRIVSDLKRTATIVVYPN